ncbi:MAG: glycosyltransferase family 9 protein [Nitrospirota bacterium]
MRYKIINKKKLYATALADLIGSVVFLPKFLLRKNEKISPKEIRSILVIRTAYIGDAIMTLPVLRPLRERFTKAKISFLTSAGAADLIANNPWLDEVIAYDPFWFYQSEKGTYLDFINNMRKRYFDLVIEARGDIREFLFILWPLKARYKVSYSIGGGGYFLTHIVPYRGLKHKVEYHLDIARHLGCSAEGAEWGIYLTEDEKKGIRDLINSAGIRKPFVCVHPGARLPLKMWMPERYALLCDGIIKRFSLPVVLLGASGEIKAIDDIIRHMEDKPVSLAGRLSLRELAGVIAESSLLICNDSSPMHIAAAMKTPVVAIFGPSKSRETAPYGNVNRVVEKDFPCRYSCDENTCRHKRFHSCMREVSVDDVSNAVEDIIRELGDLHVQV